MKDFFKKFEGTEVFISEKRDGNMKLLAENSEKNRRKFLTEKGFKYSQLISAKLEHGNKVSIVKNSEIQKAFFDYCDGLLTSSPNLILSVTIADCFPVFLFDPNQKVVGILHCGWRSVAKGIIEKALKKMKKNFDCKLNQVMIGIGPGIQKCHFKVKSEFKKEFSEYEKFFISEDGKIFLDLNGIIIEKLILQGIARKNIESSGQCTFCENKFWSYRRDGVDENEDVRAMMATISIN